MNRRGDAPPSLVTVPLMVAKSNAATKWVDAAVTEQRTPLGEGGGEAGGSA